MLVDKTTRTYTITLSKQGANDECIRCSQTKRFRTAVFR